jgi:hypothetical protein
MGLPRMVPVDYLRTGVIFSCHIRRFGFVAVHMFFPDLTAIMRHFFGEFFKVYWLVLKKQM